MKNIEMKVEGNILTIKVDLTKDFGPSSSGKNIIIASTEGNVSVDGHEEAKVGLNVYRKKELCIFIATDVLNCIFLLPLPDGAIINVYP